MLDRLLEALPPQRGRVTQVRLLPDLPLLPGPGVIGAGHWEPGWAGGRDGEPWESQPRVSAGIREVFDYPAVFSHSS